MVSDSVRVLVLGQEDSVYVRTRNKCAGWHSIGQIKGNDHSIAAVSVGHFSYPRGDGSVGDNVFLRLDQPYCGTMVECAKGLL